METRGFTLIELLVVITIIATLAGLTTVLVSTGNHMGNRQACTHNVQQLVGAIEALDGGRYPPQTGVNLLLVLAARGEIAGRDGLPVFFCPGDPNESLAEAGGAEAYENLDLTQEGHGRLTSYAAAGKRLRKGAMPPRILIADDSDDHHNGKGIVIGLTGGAAKWRDKFDDYGLAKDKPLVVGEGSAIEELACLRGD